MSWFDNVLFGILVLVFVVMGSHGCQEPKQITQNDKNIDISFES